MSQPNQPARSRETVLVVEDSAESNRLICETLRDTYTVESAYDGVDGLAKALALKPAVIVTDIVMPRMNGLDMVAQIRAHPDLADTSILIVSAKDDDALEFDLVEGSAQDFISKPFSPRDLRLRVRNLMLVREAHAKQRQETLINEALYRVAVSFADELDQQKLLQLVTDEATVLTGAQFGAFFFNALNDSGEAYLLYTLSGAPPEAFAKFPMPRATPIFGPTFRGEGVMRLGDVRKDARYGKWGPQPTGHLPVVSYLAVPVIARGGEVLGGLFFGHEQPDVFTETHERVAVGLAIQAAGALDKARLVKALRNSESRAREADRRKDEFLAMLGHELRNPLAPITTALHLMELRGETGGAKERLMIDRQVKHLTRLVDDLLDIARVTRGKIHVDKHRINLAAAIDKAVEMASPLLEQRQHTLKLEVARQGLVVDGDLQRLAQVVANLLTNAAKFTPPGGVVTLGASAKGDRVSISVSDNGQGIAGDLIGDIFGLFVQGPQTPERAQGGLGIGLALVKNLVEIHGGRVSAASEGVDRGSTFVVELPIADGDVVPTPMPEIITKSRRPRLQSKILVVDDNIDAAASLAETLAHFGHEVKVAHDGPQALSVAESFKPNAVLLDIGLPLMDGYELARALRRVWDDPSPRFVAITGYGQESDKERARAAGFDAHMVKPVDVNALVALLAPT